MFVATAALLILIVIYFVVISAKPNRSPVEESACPGPEGTDKTVPGRQSAAEGSSAAEK
jgi:hypothetical protein